MAQTRLRTQDPRWQASTRGVKGRAVRLHLLSRLTEKQYRRVALLYGFDGPEMSVREVAEAEDVSKPAVHYVRHKVLDKMSSDGYLWVLWLMHRSLGVNDDGLSEAPEENGDISQEEINEILALRGGRILDKRGDELRWESERFGPESSYDRKIDRLTDEFANGSFTRVEYDRDMVLALAEDLRPDSDALEEDWIELKQEVEWACGAFEMGAIQKRERDRRVSLALRTYVSKG